MRARLLPLWPDLALYGIYPWNYTRLSLPELDTYIDAIAERRWHGRK